MKNLLEAAEDYTKQAGLAGPGRVEVLHVRSGLAAGAGRTAPLAQKAGRGAAVLFAATCIPQAAKFPALAVRRTQGTEAKRERPRILLQKMRGRAGAALL